MKTGRHDTYNLGCYT